MADATVTREQIQERVTEALVELGADKDQIKPEAEFEALDLDSLDLVELAQIVEEEWGVEITAKDMESMKTVGQALDLVEQRAS
ncbi:MAG: acyl carrier protein [Thermoleophilaceae bacterium]|nr:acyl carrier protein [Thermoleophilaceae bacterium]